MKLKIITALTAAAVIFVSNTAYSFDTNMNDGLLMLVNGDYTINGDKNVSLFDITSFMPANKKGIMLRRETADALFVMYSDMSAAGLSPVAVSGYRSTDYQRRLFDREVRTQKSIGSTNPASRASYFTAVPNTSEHQMGLAVDISDNAALSETFETTAEGKWLAQNCWRYGFVLRYAKNKENITGKSYEPWHFRYVGKPHAEYMTKYNLVLEEYIAKLHTRGEIEMLSELDGKQYRIICTDDVRADFEDMVSVSYDNAGRYVITTLGGDEKKHTPLPAVPKFKTEKESGENRLALLAGKARIQCENTGKYIKEVLIPRMNDARKKFEHGVENIVNKIFEPVYIGGNK